MPYLYLIALGSNMPHHRHGSPRSVIAAALEALQSESANIERHSQVFMTAPVGPSRRQFANAAAILESGLEPPDMLAMLERIELGFGRRKRGRLWAARVLDLDIVLWSGGAWVSAGLVIPHRRFRERDFVLRPAAAIAPGWRDPVTNLTVRQLHARLTRTRPIPR